MSNLFFSLCLRPFRDNVTKQERQKQITKRPTRSLAHTKKYQDGVKRRRALSSQFRRRKPGERLRKPVMHGDRSPLQLCVSSDLGLDLGAPLVPGLICRIKRLDCAPSSLLVIRSKSAEPRCEAACYLQLTYSIASHHSLQPQQTIRIITDATTANHRSLNPSANHYWS